ncbi:MAG: sporulation transcriptional regulator SpoIIID [Clostridia bacterium]|nr:sporulation transcriptional regulator SpoIIID [Clostridia bacterium]
MKIIKTMQTTKIILTTKILPLQKVTSVHKDVSERLLKINPSLASEVRGILDENKAERHIRGGLATKLKYSKQHDEER